MHFQFSFPFRQYVILRLYKMMPALLCVLMVLDLDSCHMVFRPAIFPLLVPHGLLLQAMPST